MMIVIGSIVKEMPGDKCRDRNANIYFAREVSGERRGKGGPFSESAKWTVISYSFWKILHKDCSLAPLGMRLMVLPLPVLREFGVQLTGSVLNVKD